MTSTTERPLPSFADLRLLAGTPMAHACTELRTMQVACAEWDIRLAEAPADHTAETARRAAAARFFHWPESTLTLADWLRLAVRDALVIDATTIYLRSAKTPGAGLLGSSLYGLELLNGTWVLPPAGAGDCARQFALDVTRGPHGTPPAPPAETVSFYGEGEILYLPRERQPGSLFGWPPLERAIRYDGDGRYDPEATQAAIPAAFGLEFTPPAGFGEIRDPAGATLDARLRQWLKGIFDAILHDHAGAADLEWSWLDADGQPERFPALPA
jgi:hypothetical protein